MQIKKFNIEQAFQSKICCQEIILMAINQSIENILHTVSAYYYFSLNISKRHYFTKWRGIITRDEKINKIRKFE